MRIYDRPGMIWLEFRSGRGRVQGTIFANAAQIETISFNQDGRGDGEVHFKSGRRIAVDEMESSFREIMGGGRPR